jgi:hypothetical protein
MHAEYRLPASGLGTRDCTHQLPEAQLDQDPLHQDEVAADGPQLLLDLFIEIRVTDNGVDL